MTDIMNAEMLVKKLFLTPKLLGRAQSIFLELQNRGYGISKGFPLFVKDNPVSPFGQECTDFFHTVEAILTRDNNLSKLLKASDKEQWLNLSHWARNDDDVYGHSIDICFMLLQKFKPTIDDHVANLSNRELVDELGLETDRYNLTNLSDPRIIIGRHSITLDGDTTIFPHQFMRRYYSANFVGMPSMLAYAKSLELNISARIDPIRKTEAKNFTLEGLMEADFWGGQPFNEKILNDKHTRGKARHGSSGYFDYYYHPTFTIFRTKMMDSGTTEREFSIEEYCTLEAPNGEPAPGWGTEFYIQKFGHLVFDQTKQCFNHVDGAVRVFKADDYWAYYNQALSSDVPEQIGERHKMFLINGEFGIEFAQKILTEWFRYNPHITEYFSGVREKPPITYEQYEAIKAQPPLYNQAHDCEPNSY